MNVDFKNPQQNASILNSMRWEKDQTARSKESNYWEAMYSSCNAPN